LLSAGGYERTKRALRVRPFATGSGTEAFLERRACPRPAFGSVCMTAKSAMLESRDSPPAGVRPAKNSRARRCVARPRNAAVLF
jgi:hypothetical protein